MATAPDAPPPSAAAVIATPAFGELVRGRRSFALTATAVGFGAYLLLIVVSGFTEALRAPFFGFASWTFVLTAVIFPLVWLLCGLYVRRAATWDRLAEQALVEAAGETSEARR
ncbi:DUF485 domain-containing protein [Actinomycetospora termitidis]|uniref:DUF485 domain-containing protein n=1 Tax=Actinomycetospora termitidis TaxID=3053470 RepID=A0ABT7MDY5_9PSEU|nr:DUF485 domain-containing protein [Actinomycetospora sp. Odt1-22]MDL5158880.1 DUF485 domain-containing protein [Actinomycetospora sp. Odt1-22]